MKIRSATPINKKPRIIAGLLVKTYPTDFIS